MTQARELSLQERFASKSICFGCGPANKMGLRIRSIPVNGEVVCDWTPQNFHEAFPGVLNGGIIGALLDCHSNWTAAWHLMNRNGWDRPRCTVTAKYAIELKRPTPSGKPVHLVARVTDSTDDRATVTAELLCEGKVCATCSGVFVAVKEGHPAYHRWE